MHPSTARFELVDDPIELRPWKPQQKLPASGFGLLKSQRPPVPVDFDAASSTCRHGW